MRMRTTATWLRLNPFTSDEAWALSAAGTGDLVDELARRHPDVDLSAITAQTPEDPDRPSTPGAGHTPD